MNITNTKINKFYNIWNIKYELDKSRPSDVRSYGSPMLSPCVKQDSA